MRSGLIYRSGIMHQLTVNDKARLANLGIRAIIDLRSNHEREVAPFTSDETWRADYWSRDYASSNADLRSLRHRDDVGPDHARSIMIDLYRSLPYDHAEAYRELFKRIAEGDLPLVFNCSAGKDRTGVAAILLLDLLGVSRDDIMADYLFTNRFNDAIWSRLNDKFQSFQDRELWAPVFTCTQDYADTLFEAIEASDGSLASYRRTVLGMTEDVEAAIRGRLLEV